jgi:autotransporter adhesin
LFTQPTGSFTAGFYKYTVTNGTNARTGEVMAVWNGGNVEFTDFSTVDLGSTLVVTASVVIASAEAQLNIITNTSGWSIKALATYM